MDSQALENITPPDSGVLELAHTCFWKLAIKYSEILQTGGQTIGSLK